MTWHGSNILGGASAVRDAQHLRFAAAADGKNFPLSLPCTGVGPAAGGVADQIAAIVDRNVGHCHTQQRHHRPQLAADVEEEVGLNRKNS